MKINTQRIQDYEIDSLVDGELAEVERRELFLRIKEQPDQWQRLALAFLEAQSFNTSLGHSENVVVPKVPSSIAVAKYVSPKPLSKRFLWKNMMAIAACMLLSFLLGLATLRVQTDANNPDALAIKPNPQLENLPPTNPQYPLLMTRNLSDEAKQELERRGFTVREQPRLVHIDFRGQSVPVIVHQITVCYVGKRSLL
jgi:hypothetical protein